ncbi:hypothetical protein yaldo0001_29040 [Yersinia aldovae ATCC 35236]|nr:hypothetical protein yaldo0001_29040 [Yersinia aldovae ATCC 35236]
MIYDIGYHYHLGICHYDYSQISSLPFVGGYWGLEPWNVQWVGDIAAFCFATATGMG